MKPWALSSPSHKPQLTAAWGLTETCSAYSAQARVRAHEPGFGGVDGDVVWTLAPALVLRHIRQTLSLPPKASARAHPSVKRASASCFRLAVGSPQFLHTPSQDPQLGCRLLAKQALEQRAGRSRRGRLGKATAPAREDVASTPYASASRSHDKGRCPRGRERSHG